MNLKKKLVLILILGALPCFGASVSFYANVEELYSVLNKANIKDLKSAINKLDDKFFSYGQYAVIFRSQSIQPSSYEFPRILLFGKDRKLRIGINHNLGSERNLEIIQYRPKGKVWELREIKFNDNKLTMSKPNPSLCMSCHGDREIKPSFRGKIAQINDYKMSYLRKGSKSDISIFKKSISTDSLYSRLESLNQYLRDLEL